jgi:hypothetical protein
MHVAEWSKSEIAYGRRVLNSGLEGVRSGRKAFLHGRPVTPFFRESFRKALVPAAIGTLVGVVAGCPARRPRSTVQRVVSAVLGGAIGFGAGVVWENRSLVVSAANSALKNIGKVRDEHWLERHPIDYA